MELNQKIIIGVLIIVLAILCCCIGFSLLTPQVEYTTLNISESGTTMEIPKDMALKSNNSESGITVLESDDTIVIIFNSANKNVAQVMSFADIKNPIFGNEFSGNTTLKDPTVAGCNLDGECNAVFIGNSETHDNIIVISKNKDIVSHIIDSIHWKNGAADNSTSSDSASVSSPSNSSNNDKNNDKKYTEEDLYHAWENGYDTGYDEQAETTYDDDDYEDYDYGSHSQSSSSSGSSNVETTTG